MYTAVIIITVLISVLLILVVLVQKSKGLASNFSGANQIMGVRRSNDFIEKATWTLAAIVAILSISSAFISPRTSGTNGPRVRIEEKVVNGVEYSTDAQQLPAATDAAPADSAK